ncbi:Hypothetical predicted protein [Scomber scombrus]|uniref:Uncharacterized protein n=1 Tax=Scomber scombrus TaxID=13677 RepID=A0AAV1PY00_SCOSC
MTWSSTPTEQNKFILDLCTFDLDHNVIFKFTDDTTILGLINYYNETLYRQQDNEPSLLQDPEQLKKPGLSSRPLTQAYRGLIESILTNQRNHQTAAEETLSDRLERFLIRRRFEELADHQYATRSTLSASYQKFSCQETSELEESGSTIKRLEEQRRAKSRSTGTTKLCR